MITFSRLKLFMLRAVYSICLFVMSIFSDASTQPQFTPSRVSSTGSLHQGIRPGSINERSGSERFEDPVTENSRYGIYSNWLPVWGFSQTPDSILSLLNACSLPYLRWKGISCDPSDRFDGLSQRQEPRLPRCRPSRVVKARSQPLTDDEPHPLATDLAVGPLDANINAELAAQASIYDSSAERSVKLPLKYIRQVKPGHCTRLHLCRDVRLAVRDKRALHEGSLVFCIDPSYTYIDRKAAFPDEFQLSRGDRYIVYRLYADLWALCIKITFDPRVPIFSWMKDGKMDIGFLPLCAVTLAGEIDAFANRCLDYTSDPQSTARYPGNGLTVVPPARSHSLNASKRIAQGDGIGDQLPPFMSAWGDDSLEGTDMDFIPLDANMRHLFSNFGGWRERAHELRSRVSIRNLRRRRSSEQRSSVNSNLTQGASSRSSHMEEAEGASSEGLANSVGSSSSKSKWRQVGESAREQTKRLRNSLRSGRRRSAL